MGSQVTSCMKIHNEYDLHHLITDHNSSLANKIEEQRHKNIWIPNDSSNLTHELRIIKDNLGAFYLLHLAYITGVSQSAMHDGFIEAQT